MTESIDIVNYHNTFLLDHNALQTAVSEIIEHYSKWDAAEKHLVCKNAVFLSQRFLDDLLLEVQDVSDELVETAIWQFSKGFGNQAIATLGLGSDKPNLVRDLFDMWEEYRNTLCPADEIYREAMYYVYTIERKCSHVK